MNVIEKLEAEVIQDQANLEKKREALRLLKEADGRLQEVPGLISYGTVTMEPRILFDVVSANFDDENFELIFNSRERDTGVEQFARRSGFWNGMFADLPEDERNYRRVMFAFCDAFTHELLEFVKVKGQRRDPHDTDPKMKIADLPKVYQDTLAYWCALRNLGFDAADIYFGFGEVSGQSDIVHLQLQTQGKEFTITVGQLPGATEEEVHKTWMQAGAAIHESTEKERQACYEAHLIGSNLDYYTTFVGAITHKGIICPAIAHLTRNKA